MSEDPKKAGGDEHPQGEAGEQDEDARAFVLSRRAKFVAAAIASGVAGAGYVAYNWAVPDDDAALNEGAGTRDEAETDASDELDDVPTRR
jgi:hypothetical protein